MNELIKELAMQTDIWCDQNIAQGSPMYNNQWEQKFANLIVQECIDKIETHRIPVGNSAAGEMACEWTYAALKEFRDEIKQHFGVEE